MTISRTLAILPLLALVLVGTEASAQFFIQANGGGVVAQDTRRGIFGDVRKQTTVFANGAVSDQTRRRSTVSGGVGVPVAAGFNNKFGAAFFGGGNVALAVNTNVPFSNFSRGTNFNGNGRFNAFGVRTVQDGNGNVFEQDAFGNVRFVGSRFGSSVSSSVRGFNFIPQGVNQFSQFNVGRANRINGFGVAAVSPFGVVSFNNRGFNNRGFNTFNNRGFNSFNNHGGCR
jgi:hypothetical protein